MRLMAAAWLAVLLLLGGCSLIRPGAAPMPRLNAGGLDVFELEGRISVKTDSQSFAGGISWLHRGDVDEILLSTPLGQGVAELRGSRLGVTLTDNDGRQYNAADAESLLETHLGVRLPMSGLIHWLAARPRPGSAYTLEPDADGHVGALVQDGWRIDYGRYAQLGDRWLPGKLFARHSDTLEFRLVVNKWQLP